jgi:DNA-binding CsgD family transcriptional regulator
VSLISTYVIDLIDPALRETSAARVGRAFYRALQPLGVRAIYARAYRHSTDLTGTEEHVFSRISPAGWESLYSEKRFQDVNYLTREVRRRLHPFRWSDIPLINADERAMAQAVIDFGTSDGLATPCHGPGGYVGVVSLAFSALADLAPAERSAIQFASIVLHDRMHELTAFRPVDAPRLSRRERDCICFIAEGKSDWEISVIMGISHATVVGYVQNAKRKLGASTRAQAVSRCLTAGLL